MRLRIVLGTVMRRHRPPGRAGLARAAPTRWTVPTLAALCVAGCVSERASDASDGGAGSIRVTDASGAVVTLAGRARRIVSLVPSATRTLRAIAADDALVGRTDFDREAWALRLSSVGGGIEPNLEAIVALEPDLVIRFEGTQDPRTPRLLDDLGIAHLAVRPDRLEDIYLTTQILGEVTGHEEEARSLVASIRQGLGELAGKTAALPRRRVAYVLGGTPPLVSGPGTYIDEIVSLAGGDNVFHDLGALYSAVSPEQMRTRDIEIVLYSGDATFDTTLTPGARLVEVGDALEIPGPDVVDAAYRVAELLHGRSLR